MGKRGPKAKSNKMKELEGNPGQRKLTEPEEELDLSTGSLRIPTRLCTDGKEVWRNLLSSFASWYFTWDDKTTSSLFRLLFWRHLSGTGLQRRLPFNFN